MGPSGKNTHHRRPNQENLAAKKDSSEADAAEKNAKIAEERRLNALRADVAKGLPVLDEVDAHARETRVKFEKAKQAEKAAGEAKRLAAAARRAATKAAAAEVDEPKVATVAQGDVSSAIFE
jgi:hypothetical protein